MAVGWKLKPYHIPAAGPGIKGQAQDALCVGLLSLSLNGQRLCKGREQENTSDILDGLCLCPKLISQRENNDQQGSEDQLSSHMP